MRVGRAVESRADPESVFPVQPPAYVPRIDTPNGERDRTGSPFDRAWSVHRDLWQVVQGLKKSGGQGSFVGKNALGPHPLQEPEPTPEPGDSGGVGSPRLVAIRQEIRLGVELRGTPGPAVNQGPRPNVVSQTQDADPGGAHETLVPTHRQGAHAKTFQIERNESAGLRGVHNERDFPVEPPSNVRERLERAADIRCMIDNRQTRTGLHSTSQIVDPPGPRERRERP